MPPVAGNLKWSQELRNRILTNRSNLCQLAHMYEPYTHTSPKQCAKEISITGRNFYTFALFKYSLKKHIFKKQILFLSRTFILLTVFLPSLLLCPPGLSGVLRQTMSCRSVSMFWRFWTSMTRNCSQNGLRDWRKSVKPTCRSHCSNWTLIQACSRSTSVLP